MLPAMMQPPVFSRRHLLATAAAMALAAPARAAGALHATDFGVIPDLDEDQTEALQEALDAAAAGGQALHLPAGTVLVQGLVFPGNLAIEGVPGSSMLEGWQGATIGMVSGVSHLALRHVGFGGGGAGDANLLEIAAADSVLLEACRFTDSPASALSIFDAAVTIRDCEFARHADAAIHALDSRGLLIAGNRISDCGNAGIRIWRSESGPDGSIITANRIASIDWRGGGNGQNGNGINIYKADEVIVADNHIADCAFTAVRLNSTNNCQVTGNTCLRSGEVAIFSEFAFSGSVIANNIVDGAATGISITNLDSGGQLAVCAGNIVRNITPASVVNPDTIPIGIYAEAETAITGNTVQSVPGVAIVAGNGTFLRNVLISANVVYASNIGIGVSVVEDAGPVHIADNMIYDPLDHAMVGLAWTEIVETDLAANVDRYLNVTISGPQSYL